MEVITEGKARILKQNVVGKIDAAQPRKRPTPDSEPAGRKNTLFYNPAQVFNRDLSLVAIKVFGERRVSAGFRRYEDAVGKIRVSPDVKGLHILEPLAATGLRSLRYAQELPKTIFRKVTTADIDSEAVEGAKRNRELNNVSEHRMELVCAEATELMHAGRYVCGTSQWDVVDIDPYGTATPFLDAAVKAVKTGGLLCVTSTDMPVLGGNTPDVAFYKYGGSTVKARYLHEMALRLVVHQVQMIAAKYRRYALPLLSISVDFYVRVFVQILDKPLQCATLATQTAVVFQCSNCDHFVTAPFGRFVAQRDARQNHKRRRRDRNEEHDNRHQTPDASQGKEQTEEAETNGDAEAAMPDGDCVPESEETSAGISQDVDEGAETQATDDSGPERLVQTYPAEAKDDRRFVLGRLAADTPGEKCSECGASVVMAGPFYAGPLHDMSFVAACIAELEKANAASEATLNVLADDIAPEELEKATEAMIDAPVERGDDENALAWVPEAHARLRCEMQTFRFTNLSKFVHEKIVGVLRACENELPDVPLFYKLPSICNQARIDMIKMDRFKSALLNLGYRVGLFHREPLSIKTDAPASVMYDLIRAWIKMRKAEDPSAANKFQRVPENFLRDAPADFHPSFAYHHSLNESKSAKSKPKWMPNPTANWGPGRRAGK